MRPGPWIFYLLCLYVLSFCPEINIVEIVEVQDINESNHSYAKDGQMWLPRSRDNQKIQLGNQSWNISYSIRAGRPN